MAQKRMFDKRVVCSDKFTDLPNSSKALYFMAGMEADDKGFFQPRRLQKLCGFTEDDFKILIAKRFFIPFKSGVMVVTDWNKNNWLDSRRVTETEYVEELKMLKLINERYEILDSSLDIEIDSKLDVAKQMLSENRIEENSIIIKEEITKEEKKKKYGTFDNVKLTDTEYQKLKEKFVDYERKIENLSHYLEMKGDKYKSHYATILNWARKDDNEERSKVPSWYGKKLAKNENGCNELSEILKDFN